MQKEELIELINMGYLKWNLFRIKHPEFIPDLSDINLSKKDLRNYNFSKSKLLRTNFQKSHLGETDFSGSTVAYANFKNSYFSNVNFNNADLRFSNLKSTIIKNSVFDNSLFNHSTLNGSKIKNSSFIKSNFRNSELCSVYFDNCITKKAHFEGSFLRETMFINSNLQLIKMNNCKFLFLSFDNCNFRNGMLYDSIFDNCQFYMCNFTYTLLTNSTIINSTITKSDFSNVDFRHSQFSANKLEDSDLSRSKIFGVSTWKLNLINTTQNDLRITDINEPKITIDNIEVAQFIYLLLNNAKLREIIDTVTSKVVLILGRFTENRKKILEELRNTLKTKNFLPIIIDFDVPHSRTTLETISTVAHMAKFIIADLSDSKSVLQELQFIVTNLPSVIVQPIIDNSDDPPGMIDHFCMYKSFLPTISYDNKVGIPKTVIDLFNNFQNTGLLNNS